MLGWASVRVLAAAGCSADVTGEGGSGGSGSGGSGGNGAGEGGTQLGGSEADADGVVTFTTIFPACYRGRWPHIHSRSMPI